MKDKWFILAAALGAASLALWARQQDVGRYQFSLDSEEVLDTKTGIVYFKAALCTLKKP